MFPFWERHFQGCAGVKFAQTTRGVPWMMSYKTQFEVTDIVFFKGQKFFIMHLKYKPLMFLI